MAAKRGEVETLSRLLDRSSFPPYLIVNCQSCLQPDVKTNSYLSSPGQSLLFVGRAPLEQVFCTLQLLQKGFSVCNQSFTLKNMTQSKKKDPSSKMTHNKNDSNFKKILPNFKNVPSFKKTLVREAIL